MLYRVVLVFFVLFTLTQGGQKCYAYEKAVTLSQAITSVNPTADIRFYIDSQGYAAVDDIRGLSASE